MTIFVINEQVDLSKSCQYLRLPHPRTGQPQLYLPTTSCSNSGSRIVTNDEEPERYYGLVQVVRFNKGRTWFILPDTIDVGDILLHIPIDPLFLVIPLITSLIPNGDSNTPFQPLEDLFSQLISSSSFAIPPPFSKEPQNGDKNEEGRYNPDIGRLLEIRIISDVFKLCCDQKDISSETEITETYYRPSLSLILNLIQQKVDHFQRNEFHKFDHLIRSLLRDGILVHTDQGDYGLATGVEEMVWEQARQKAAVEHMNEWLSSVVQTALMDTYDFSALKNHLANRAAADIISSQPVVNDKPKAGVKRKAPPASRGVEMLKKVNTSNMSKLTSFFKPKPEK
ncbi:hypothetical protein M231_04940 [Tremella mesenterica]|uniref:Ribonuclease H2 subunit B wHTH domain-containing protein n=1 Tax=Tremella mesenterica TaxID=5217 RepID=A0A4Q1BJA4_TREME|nr:uncharacterized protein TREMEDRAFT_58416 [Tremella mesenterica DSM 1558]EIW72256.1 hypothetical protein TREMEDRAFT_58416 [Tremella mesenterica DSM 1558]RXK37784.1 hypothetical protein M231_04940 [Tremella mesenterica]